MTTDRVGPGLHNITHDKHAYRAEIRHRNAGLRADHLFGHTRLYLRARILEAQAADRDRAELRETDVPIAVHDEGILPLGAAEQLDLEDVARPDHIIDRHRNSYDRLEGGRRRREQVVAEGLECGLEWQQRQPDPEILQQPLDRKPLRRLERRQPRHRDRGEPGQIERPGTRQTVRISATHGVDQALRVSRSRLRRGLSIQHPEVSVPTQVPESLSDGGACVATAGLSGEVGCGNI